MGLNISYMGTKKHLASVVAGAMRDLPSGPVLDAFAGMGAVCETQAGKRTVWVNDFQQFASSVSRALFTSKRRPPPSADIERILRQSFEKNMRALSKRFADQQAAEERVNTI